MAKRFIKTIGDEGGVEVFEEDATLRPPKPVAREEVNVERSVRIAAGTEVVVAGLAEPVALQGRQQDLSNMLGLAMAAQLRIAQGDTQTQTTFRDRDNMDHVLVPAQVLELWQKGAAWVQTQYDASWALKAMDPIPADYADDVHWRVS